MPDPTLSVAGLSVFVAIPVNRDFPWQTHASLVKTYTELHNRGIPYVEQLLVGGSIIQSARSELAHMFLKSQCDRLFWIDSDMAWEPDAFLRILALSTVMPVIGAAYPAKEGPHVKFMMNLVSDQMPTNEWGCLEVRGMGLGFTCVKREVIEFLAKWSFEVAKNGEHVSQIFRAGVEGGRFIGEDMNFFEDCRAAGYKVHVDPSVTLGHIGSHAYTGRLMDALQNVTG